MRKPTCNQAWKSCGRVVFVFSLMLLLGGCFCADVPQAQKLADCTSNEFSFKLSWPTGKLFQVVLGVPYTDTNALTFDGELVFRQNTGTVARVALTSDDVTPCNWLDNQTTHPRGAGYILTWGRTNTLSPLFTKGQTYDVNVRFTEAPPPTSTLWLHWIGQVR